MASRLTGIADSVKKGSIAMGAAIVLLIIFKWLFDTTVTLFTPATPAPTPYLALKYGQLPALQLPSDTRRSNDASWILSTLTGRIEESTDSAVIYELKKQQPTLDFATKSKTIADRYGFTNVTESKISNTEFLYRGAVDSSQTLKINFVNWNLDYKYEDISPYIPLETGSAPPPSAISNQVSNYINIVSPFNLIDRKDIDLARNIRTEYYYFNTNTRDKRRVSSNSQANVAEAQIFRNLVDNKYPIIGPSTEKSNIHFVFSGISTTLNPAGSIRLLQAEVTYWPFDITDKTAVYPLRTANQAYDELKNGDGYILTPGLSGESLTIRRVYLGYYESKDVSDFLLPVWVFEGDKTNDTDVSMKAIVPAVGNQYMVASN